MSRNASPPEPNEAPFVDYGHAAVRRGAAGKVPGAPVRDTAGESDPAVVVHRFCRPISEVYVEIEVEGTRELKTVADLNPSYDESEECIKIAFVPDLDTHLPDWRSIDRAMLHPQLQQTDVTTYDYPAPRLEVISNE